MPDFGVTNEQFQETERLRALKFLETMDIGPILRYEDWHIRRISKDQFHLIKMGGTAEEIAHFLAKDAVFGN